MVQKLRHTVARAFSGLGLGVGLGIDGTIVLSWTLIVRMGMSTVLFNFLLRVEYSINPNSDFWISWGVLSFAYTVPATSLHVLAIHTSRTSTAIIDRKRFWDEDNFPALSCDLNNCLTAVRPAANYFPDVMHNIHDIYEEGR